MYSYQVVPGGRSVGTWQVKMDTPPAPALEVQTTADNKGMGMSRSWCHQLSG
jgi:hypothetical protein